MIFLFKKLDTNGDFLWEKQMGGPNFDRGHSIVTDAAGKKKPADEVMINEAETVLRKLEADGKASSKSYGIWGRIYKDKFERAFNTGNRGEAKGHLKNALKYYEKGFESDPRDA